MLYISFTFPFSFPFLSLLVMSKTKENHKQGRLTFIYFLILNQIELYSFLNHVIILKKN